MAKAKKKARGISAKGKRKAGKPSGKTTTELSADVSALRRDVKSLKVLLAAPFHVRLAAIKLDADPLKSPEIVAQDLVQATFKVTAGDPTFVRLTLDGTDEVISPPATEGEAKPRQRGTWTHAFLEVRGNGGSKVVITTENTMPASIEITIPPGASGNAGTKPLLIV